MNWFGADSKREALDIENYREKTIKRIPESVKVLQIKNCPNLQELPKLPFKLTLLHCENCPSLRNLKFPVSDLFKVVILINCGVNKLFVPRSIEKLVLVDCKFLSKISLDQYSSHIKQIHIEGCDKILFKPRLYSEYANKRIRYTGQKLYTPEEFEKHLAILTLEEVAGGQFAENQVGGIVSEYMSFGEISHRKSKKKSSKKKRKSR